MIGAYELKLFDKYPYEGVAVNDISLERYISVDAQSSYPHTAGTVSSKQFGKGKVPITERFVCGLMRKGRNNGKKRLAMAALRDAFVIIDALTGRNPLQVLVDALINSGPREDCARIGKGGAMKRTAVDVSPLRRLNIAISLLCKGIRNTAMKGPKTIAEAVADELVAASRNSPSSYAVKKKDEIERMAKSNR